MNCQIINTAVVTNMETQQETVGGGGGGGTRKPTTSSPTVVNGSEKTSRKETTTKSRDKDRRHSTSSTSKTKDRSSKQDGVTSTTTKDKSKGTTATTTTASTGTTTTTTTTSRSNSSISNNNNHNVTNTKSKSKSSSTSSHSIVPKSSRTASILKQMEQQSDHGVVHQLQPDCTDIIKGTTPKVGEVTVAPRPKEEVTTAATLPTTNTTDADPMTVSASTSPPSSLTTATTVVELAVTELAEQDEEVRLALEMALAAAQNPKLTPLELRELVGERNKQVQIVDEFAYLKKKEMERMKDMAQQKSQKRWDEKKEIAITWWQAKSYAVKETAVQITEAAVKRAEEMKQTVVMRAYAEQIQNDPIHLELRKKIKTKKKIYKLYRLQGNRTETRHIFKRQRLEKRYIQLRDKLYKTQKLFTNNAGITNSNSSGNGNQSSSSSSQGKTQNGGNVQEYLKALVKASKKWRKKGTDEELLLEAHLCRNMHQMLVLEKQKTKNKKHQRELKKYLQRCKGWLIDKRAFCEMNQMTLEATIQSMKLLYEDILNKQDALILKYQQSEEYENVDLSNVDVSHVPLPVLPGAVLRNQLQEQQEQQQQQQYQQQQHQQQQHQPRDSNRSAALNAMKGLPMLDSIRMKKEASIKNGESSFGTLSMEGSNRGSRRGGPELYVTARDDISVSSCLSDPDEPYTVKKGGLGLPPRHVTTSGNYQQQQQQQKKKNISSNSTTLSDDESDTPYLFGSDAPWMSSLTSINGSCSITTNGNSPLLKAMLPPDTIEEEDVTTGLVVTAAAAEPVSTKEPQLPTLSAEETEKKRQPQNKKKRHSITKATSDTTSTPTGSVDDSSVPT